MDVSAMELRRAVLSAKRLIATTACLDILLADVADSETGSRNSLPTSPKQSYTVREVADRWSRSPDYIRDRFRNVPGILYQDRPATKAKHRYFSFTIPAAVLLREEARQPPM
jgi:hypothetical protein